MAAGTGNRRTQDIIDFGASLAEFYDYVVIADSDPRDRSPGETSELVQQGLVKGGYSKENTKIILDEREATQEVLNMASDGDIVVIQADNVQQVINDVMDYKERITEEFVHSSKHKK